MDLGQFRSPRARLGSSPVELDQRGNSESSLWTLDSLGPQSVVTGSTGHRTPCVSDRSTGRVGERKGFFFSYQENRRPTRRNRHGMGKRLLPTI